MVEPRIVTPEIDMGPLDSVPADAVMLTTHNLHQVGGFPPRVGMDWVCVLWVYDTIVGVETVRNISTYAIAGTFWDPIARVSYDLTLGAPAAAGFFTVTFADDGDQIAGMYQFQVTATVTDVFELASGWLEILPEYP